MKPTLCIFLVVLAFSATSVTAQVAPQPTQGQVVQGTVLREGSSEPIAGAQVTLTIPAITNATEMLMSLAASFGMQPSALGNLSLKASEIREVMTEMTADEIQAEIADAKREGAPTEFVSIMDQILAAKTGSRGFPMHTLTDNTGRFTFSNVRPGDYLVTAEREGFFGNAPKGPNADLKTVAKTVTVNERQSASEVSLLMTPGARIQGRVRDNNGRPLSNLTVQAFSLAYQNGVPTLQGAAMQTTDDRGEFRLFWLEPGDYFLVAIPRASPNPTGTAAAARTTPALTFYPSNTRYTDAISLPVTAGQEVIGMEITVRTLPAIKISGKVAGLPAAPATSAPGVPTARPTIMLLERDTPFASGGFDIPSTRISVNPATGSFEITGVPSGSYDIVAQARLPGAAGARPTEFLGHVSIDVRDRDIENLTVTLQPGAEVRGHVTVQGNASGAFKDPLMVGLQPDGLLTRAYTKGADPIPNRADGSFSFVRMPVGDYKVRALGLPSFAYVVDIRQAGTSIYGSALHISDREPQPIEIIVGLDGGTVEGVAYTPDQKASPSTTVVLIPTSAADRQNSERYKMATAGTQGRFKMTSIAPGQYKVFAWKTLPFGAYQNPAFVSQYEAQGAVVDVKPSSTSNVRAAVIQN